MRVLLFGATGMLGAGVLREALLDPLVSDVVSVVRHATIRQHPKLREIIVPDLSEIESVKHRLQDCDVCFYCVGISATGVSERDYTQVTYGLTMQVATLLLGLNPAIGFLYLSATGADGSAKSRFMWARVKGQTENAVLGLPFTAKYVFRPGIIQPLHGIRSRNASYRALYGLTAPIYPMLQSMFPVAFTSTERLGRAMLQVASHGYPKAILENIDINHAQASGPTDRARA